MKRTLQLTIAAILLFTNCPAQDKWEKIFRSNDQSTLAHNLVASYDPIPHAWEGFSLAQSPTGRLLIPKVLTMHTGHVYTSSGKGSVTDQTLTSQEWLPWLYSGKNQAIKVLRTTGQDQYKCQVSLNGKRKGLLLLEIDKFYDHYYRRAADVTYTFHNNQLIFTWKDFDITFSFNKAARVELGQEPEPLLRKFQGFKDVILKDISTKGFFDRNGSVFVGITFDHIAELTVSINKKQIKASESTFSATVSKEKKYYTDFLEKQIPPISSKDPKVRDTYYFAWATFLSNHADGGYGMAPGAFESSSKYMYPGAFYWDEAFHSVILSYEKDKDAAYRFLRNFAYSQANDGGMPGSINITGDHEEYMEKANKIGSGDMQPPILSIILPQVKKRVGWPKDLPAIYDVLTKNLGWYYSQTRDSDGDGLLEYTNSYASGCDDSPRWDAQYLPGVKIGPIKPVEAVDLNVWIVNMHYLLADMAKTMGKTKEIAEHLQKAKALTEKIEDKMWDDKDGFYYDLKASSNEKIKVKTPMSFAVLHLPGINRKRLERMVKEHLINPKEFWTKYPVPSVAINEPTFDQKRMWRGPVWININWMIIDGLEKNDFIKVATDLSKKTIDLVGSRYTKGVRTRTPRFNEYFDPINGQPLGNENLTWSTLVIDLIKRQESNSIKQKR